jgi:hypothetical protein
MVESSCCSTPRELPGRLTRRHTKDLPKKIECYTGYSRVLLSICTQELHIPDGRVLQARREWETKLYTEFTISVAESFDWVGSLVAMIPCIQVSASTRASTDRSKWTKSTVIVILCDCKGFESTFKAQRYRSGFSTLLNQLADLRYRYYVVQALGHTKCWRAVSTVYPKAER